MKFHEFFSGTFSLTRKVSSPQLSISGTACFKPLSDNEYFFEESGFYALGEHTQPYYQRRYFIASEKSLHILKEDRALLHEFSWETVAQGPLCLTHTHVCGKDLYKTTFVIPSAHCFVWDYDILTPTIRYQVSSVYKRVDA